MYKLHNKAKGTMYKVVSKNCKGFSSYCCCLRVMLGLFPNIPLKRFNIRAAF